MRSYRKSSSGHPALDIMLNVSDRPSHMKQLFKLCQSKTIVWKELPYGDHNSTVAEKGYFDAFNNFLLQHVVGKKQ